MRRKFSRIKKVMFVVKSARRKIITLYENHICFAMCSILHFVTIVFAHNVVHLRLVFVELTSYILHNISSLDDRITIDFAFRNDILKILIFRRSIRSLKRVHVDFVKTLFVNLILF